MFPSSLVASLVVLVARTQRDISCCRRNEVDIQPAASTVYLNGELYRGGCLKDAHAADVGQRPVVNARSNDVNHIELES